MYLALQGMSEEQLAEAGYEESDILELKNTSIEELLYQRAQMPQSELQSLGYSAEQISVLKEYDGGPISQNSQLQEASADLTGYLYVQSSGRTAMSIMFNWTWNSPPIFSGYGITDSVGCSFVGTNFQNAICSLRVDDEDKDPGQFIEKCCTMEPPRFTMECEVKKNDPYDGYHWFSRRLGPWLFGRMIRRILDKKPYILESVLLGVFGGSLLNVIYQFLAWGNVVWTR